MAGLTLLRVVSNGEMDRAEQERMDRELQTRQQSSVMLGISAYLKECWDAAEINLRRLLD